MGGEQDAEKFRHHAISNLFWLSTEILNYQFVPHVHQPVCDLFVAKKPGVKLADQDTVKERMLLDPRGHFKTTIDLCDVVQWIILDPNVRILLLTGTRELASRMLWEVKSHFLYNEKFNILFPEHAANPKLKQFQTTEEFTTPARTLKHLREPTLSISTADSVKAGSHYDIIKVDDLVNETNVGTKEQIQKTITAFDYTRMLVEPYGYRDVVGTIYDYSDLHSKLIEDANVEGTTPRKIFKRAVWDIKEDGTKQLLFPERFTEQWLNQIQKENPYLFSCQYMNDPTPTGEKQFSHELIVARFTDPASIPQYGRIFVSWDLGFTQKSYSDFTSGAVGRFVGDSLYIMDIVHGRFSPWQLIEAILKTIVTWHPAAMSIEKAGGSDLVLPGLEMAAKSRGINLPRIDLIPTSPEKRKDVRISGLQPLMAENKLFFSTRIPPRSELIKEFVRFPNYKFKDIPDSISMLLQYRQNLMLNATDEMEMFKPNAEFLGSPVIGDGDLGAGLIG